MKDTVSRYLINFFATSEREAIRPILNPLADRYSTQSLSSAGMAITAGGSAIVKTGAAVYYGIAAGTLVSKGAATALPALVGTVINATFNVFCFYIDAAGTLTSQMGTVGAALANVIFPEPPVGKALLGFIVVNPTGTGNFVGGTTALDDATVVPNVAYINTTGAFDPSVRL